MSTVEKSTFLPIDTALALNEGLAYLDRSNIRYEVSGHIQTRARHRVEILLPGITFNDGQSELQAKLLLSNANNGTRAFMVAVGFLRLVCSNGLVVGSNTFSERIIHRNGPKTIQRVEQLPLKIAAALESLVNGEAVESLLEMRENAVSERKAIELIASLNVHDYVKRRSINQWVQPELRREADREDNLYNLYNVVNESLRRNHGLNLVYHQANDKLVEDLQFLYSQIAA